MTQQNIIDPKLLEFDASPLRQVKSLDELAN